MIVTTVLLQEVCDVLGKQLVKLALGADHFPAHQIQCLDTIGSFVDLGYAAVTNQLLLPPLADETMTTKDLLTHDAGIEAAIREKCLGHRCQQRHHTFSVFATLIILGKLGDIQPLGHVG